MDNTIQSDLIRGHINTIILKALFDGDRYGYDIVKEIEQKSSGQYKLKQPTLYSCLKRLELQGFIRSYWGAKSNGGRRKYFTLTDMGRELFIKNQSEWEYSRTVIDKLISDREVDLDSLQQPQESEESESEFVENADSFEEESAAAANLSEPVVEAITPEQSAVAATTTSAPPTFLDTTAIMNRLYEQQLETVEASYADKLVSEKYVADRTALSQSEADTPYFQDFFDEEEEARYEMEQVRQDVLQIAAEESPQKQNDAVTQTASITETDEAETALPPVPTEPIKDTTKNESYLERFHRYDEEPTERAAENIFDREYKNILSTIAESSFADSTANLADVPIADTEAKAESDSDMEDTVAQTEPETETAIEAYTSDAEVNKKLSKLTGDVREMGSNLKIRTHNSDTSKEFSNSVYYYSNKLMLIHYAILFAVMALEILGCSVIVYLGLGIHRAYDIFFYIAAVLLALAFPTIAFIKNYTAPNKRKRINFSLKSSLIYRSIVMVQCWLIVYCLNILFQMPVSFDINYLTTLLLPALLATNFPVSALIFSSLFKSKRYAVEE